MLFQAARNFPRAGRAAGQAVRSAAAVPSRAQSTKSIHEAVAEIIPGRQEYAAKIKSEHGSKSLGDIKVENVFGGMRGLKVMLWEPSVLDASEGIRFWGRSIPECQEVLPTAPGGQEMLPESMFWYLLTSQVPSEAQVRSFSAELAERANIPEWLNKVIDSYPKSLHPMTQFVSATAALNHDSKFAAAYNQGVRKNEYWKSTLEDVLDVCAKVYTIAARIYANVYQGGAGTLAPIQKDKDLCWNYANQIGFSDKEGFIEVLRLYNALHTDHEGGNVSAHTTHLVGSALSDPFLSYSAALAGLAGPLHGLANQEALKFVLNLQKAVGSDASHEKIKEELWRILKSGRVVPGYGHAVLRKPDPRFTALADFCNKKPELKEDPVFKLVRKLYEVAPGVLNEHGKTKNPNPNVDAGSGVCLYHYGMTQFEYYTVVFGTSRAMGATAQLVWDRVLGLPIERPKSLSLEAIEKLVA